MPAVSRWNAPRSRGRRLGARPAAAVAAGVAALLLGLSCAAPRPEAPPVTGIGRVSGKIVGIHPASRRVELADAGRRFSVFYSEETLIKSGAVELAMSDMQDGDRIVVSLDDAGDAHARIITLAGPLRTPAPPEDESEENDQP